MKNKNENKEKNPLLLLKRLLSYIVKNYKLACFMVVVCILVSALTTLCGTLFIQKLIDNYLGSMDVTEDNLNIVAYVSSSQLQKDLVKMGTGVAILSEYSTRDLVSSGRVLRFEMERNCLSRNIYMAKDKKGILNSLALEFDKFVKSNFKLN